MIPFNRFVASVVLCAPIACKAQSVVSLDAFEDSGFSITAVEESIGAEGPSSAIGGFRAVSFFNNFLDGTLTLDDEMNTLTLHSNGVGQVTIGYGFRVAGGGLQGGGLIPVLNADLSPYEALRFNILENQAETRHIRFNITLQSIVGSAFVSSAITIDTPDGFEGVFDIPFDSIAGDAVLSDVDLILINIPSVQQGLSWTLGPIELVDLDGDAVCAGDCDDSGAVDFADLVSMLFEFGTSPNNGCDADGSGEVNFADLVFALFAFGPCP